MRLHVVLILVVASSKAQRNPNAANPNQGSGLADPNSQGKSGNGNAQASNAARFHGCDNEAILLLKQNEAECAEVAFNYTAVMKEFQISSQNLQDCKISLSETEQYLTGAEERSKSLAETKSEYALKLKVAEIDIQELNGSLNTCGQQLESTITSCNQALTEILSNLAEIQVDTADLQKTTTAVRKENEILRETIAKLQGENERLKNQSAAVKEHMEEKVSGLEKSIAVADGKIAKLTHYHKNCVLDLETIEQSLEKETSLKEEAFANSAACYDIQESMKKYINMRTRKIERLEEAQQDLKEENSNLTMMLTECHRILNDVDYLNANLAGNIKMANATIENLTDQISVLSATEKYLKESVLLEKEKTEEISRAHNETLTELHDCLHIKEEMIKDAATHESIQRHYEVQIGDLNKEKLQYLEIVSDLNSNIVELEEHIGWMGKDLNTTKKEIESLATQTDECNEELVIITTSLKTEVERKSELSDELKGCKKENKKLNKKVGVQMKSLKKMREDFESLSISNDQLSNDFSDCQFENIVLESANSNLTETISDAEEKLANLTERLKNILGDELAGLRNKTEITEIVEEFCDLRCDAILNAKLSEMNVTIQTCQQKVGDEIMRNAKLQQKMRLSMQQYLECHEDVYSMNNTIENQEQSIDKLENELFNLVESSNANEKKLNNFHAKYHALQRENLGLKEKCSARKRRMNRRIAYVTNFALSSPAFENHGDVDVWDMLVQQGTSLVDKSIVVVKDTYPEYIDKFLDLEYEKFIIDLKKAICICQHGGKCRLTPLHNLYSWETIKNTVQKISRMINLPISREGTDWIIHISMNQVGRFPLEPKKSAFVSDMLPKLKEYTALRNEELLDQLRNKYFQCVCPEYASGDTCEDVIPIRNRRECPTDI